APVIMIEFSDYQCQFCRRFWQVNWETLKTEYIDTGKVQFVYKDFPISFHNAANGAAEAAACAEEQGRGWDLHDKMFLEQANVSTAVVFYAKSDIKQWAGEIGINQSAFDQCLDSGRYAAAVAASEAEGMEAGVTATPSFIIGTRSRDNAVPIIGSLPYGTFKATIEQLLNDSR